MNPIRLLGLKIALPLITAAASASSPAPPQASALALQGPLWGTWTINAPADPGFNPSWYRGHLVRVKWSEIEPTKSPLDSPGNFDFSSLDQQLDAVTDRGLFAMAMVTTGEDIPSWLTDPDVGAGIILDGHTYPLYLTPIAKSPNPTYLAYFHRMVNAFVGHLNGYPHNRDRIVGLGCPVGESTDPHPYSPQDPDYQGPTGFGAIGGSSFIAPDSWVVFQEQELTYYVNAVQNTSPALPCLINANYNRDTVNYALQNLVPTGNVWLKLSRIGDRYNNNGEYARDRSGVFTDDAFYVSTKTREYYNGLPVRTRSEMDLTYCHDKDPSCRDGWFREAPEWNMYWSQLWALDRGLDIHNQKDFDLENPDFTSAFQFFSKYAGYKSPQESPGAWIAFRDNLDAADTVRFPERRYGAYKNGKNPARYQAIESQFFQYGVQRPTDGDYSRSDLGKTDWNALEDVGNNTYPGNYANWITMKDPQGTSQGYWRLGDGTTGPNAQPYGRYARGFDHKTRKDNFYLDIDDRFFGPTGLGGAYPVNIRVVYWDVGTEKFSITYDDVTHVGKTAAVVTKTNTGRWQEVNVIVNDGSFSNRLAKGADIILRNDDSEDDIFHMVEITRLR
jgi:hypothetical protein